MFSTKQKRTENRGSPGLPSFFTLFLAPAGFPPSAGDDLKSSGSGGRSPPADKEPPPFPGAIIGEGKPPAMPEEWENESLPETEPPFESAGSSPPAGSSVRWGTRPPPVHPECTGPFLQNDSVPAIENSPHGTAGA